MLLLVIPDCVEGHFASTPPQPISVDVDSPTTTTIADVKQRLQKGIPRLRHSYRMRERLRMITGERIADLFYNGKLLLDAHSLADVAKTYYAPTKSPCYFLLRFQRIMQIFYEVDFARYVLLRNFAGKCVTLAVGTADTVGAVAAQVAERERLPGDVCLLFAGKQLDAQRTLADYNIQKECTVTYRALLWE